MKSLAIAPPPPRHYDDGPLLADDVTGTDAFARWNAGRLAKREA